MAAAEQTRARAERAEPEPDLAERAQEAQDEVRDALHEVDRRVRGFVSDQPLLAMGIAVGAGYLIGRLARKL